MSGEARKCSVPNIARSEVGLLGTLRFRASPDIAQPCIVELLLHYLGMPKRKDRMPSPPLSAKARDVDDAPAFPTL